MTDSNEKLTSFEEQLQSKDRVILMQAETILRLTQILETIEQSEPEQEPPAGAYLNARRNG